MSRIPPVDVIQRRHADWAEFGFPCGDGNYLQISCYIDNLYSVGKSAYAATSVLEEFDLELQRNWNCRLKPSSKEVLATKGNPDGEPCNTTWSQVSSMKILGQFMQNDGGTDICFRQTLGALWRSFFANAGSRAARRMSQRARMRLLNGATRPVLCFRLTRWPFLISRARQLDAIQKKMISITLKLRMQEGETPAGFVRRRGRLAADIQRDTGTWSQQWASQVVSWDEHLRRERNHRTWAAQLRHLRPPEELQTRRADFGRPLTRNEPGFIKARWYESVISAKRFLGKPCD